MIMKRVLSLLLALITVIGVLSGGALGVNGAGDRHTSGNSAASDWPELNTDLTHIVAYGQSFSNGSDAPGYPDPIVDGSYVLGSITGSNMGDSLIPLQMTSGNQHPIVSAVNSLSQRLTKAGIDTDILAGSYGVGGKTIAQLMSKERQAQIKTEKGYTYDCADSGRYAVFQNSVAAIADYAGRNGQTVSCPVIVYLQGETDQNTDTQLGYPENPTRAGYGAGGDKTLYKEYMKRLKEDMQSEVMEAYGQAEKPLFMIYQVSGTYTRTQYSSINMAQIEFAQENADVILVQTPYFTPHYTNSHHLTQNGYRWLGEYIGRYIYTALVEREKAWPMLPDSMEIADKNTVRLTVSGAEGGLAIDTRTVEDATNSKNRYGFYLQVDNTNVAPVAVTVSENHIELTMPERVDLFRAEKVYLYYAGKNASGTGNIRDNCSKFGFYEYLDDTNDTGTGNNQGVSHSSLDTNGNSIIGQKYPMYNWLASFCYELEVPEGAQRQAAFYHWVMLEKGLTSITEESADQNNLTLQEGSVKDGILMGARYTMEKEIVLEHDRPWAIEWRAAGNGSQYGGGKLLNASGDNGSHAQYLYLPADSRSMVAWGVSSDSANYGFLLKDSGIDSRTEHTYRIENRIADDGVNTVWLIVDGVEIGTMNTGYRTSSNTGGAAGSMIEEPKNWANGKNIYLDSIGAGGSFLLKNMKLSYLKVWEDSAAHTHAYTAVVTSPTCTEQGYTTHTCACGDSYVADFVDATGHTYENGICNRCGENEPYESMSLRYDDHYDVTGKTVEIIDAGKPTSYQVGYGVEEHKVPDVAVVTMKDNALVATGIGTANVMIDGQLYEITVTAAPINLLLLIGQSNMEGNEGEAKQSIVCEDGTVYATYGDRYDMVLANATHYAPSALTGTYRTVNAVGGTDGLSDYPVYMLTDEGDGRKGPDSGFAYEWVKQTGEKVWIVNAAHGGTSLDVWQPGTTQYEECEAMFGACAETLRKEIAAGHFTLNHMAYFWCQGCNDYNKTAAWYVENYLSMHESLKKELAFDHDSDSATPDKTFEYAGIIPVRAGREWLDFYRKGTYTDTTDKSYYESFKDLLMSGPRVAQYWMTNNPELPEIWNVCTIGEDWVWMPDGTNGVTDYFQTHYPGGTVDYTTQVQQPASWYTPTTPNAVHDSIHYNQIGYNEVGRESVRNALILMGINPDYDEETTVEFVNWTGYQPVSEIPACTVGQSASLVVPIVRPVTRTKTVTYSLAEELRWDYYDLLAETPQTTGNLISGTGEAVSVVKQTPGTHFADHLSHLPENLCCGVNLWPILNHDSQYYTVNGWGTHASGKVYSVTIPVKPGDRIHATSFGAYGTNGNTVSTGNGIRCTFLGEYDVVQSLSSDQTYAQFSANGGYLVVPEGTVAINIPMWTNDNSNELYILNLPHDTNDGICGICNKDSHFHNWSEWKTTILPTAEIPGEEQRTCVCGKTESREIPGVWQTHDLGKYLLTMPENYCSGTNLWPILPHTQTYYYGGTHWAPNISADVWAVTIPVQAEDKIFATAFCKAGENGYSSNGIRVTFFDAYGVAKTTTPAETYAELVANGGYLVAPEGTVAVNIPMYGDKDTHELYILNREHIYENGICTGCSQKNNYNGHLQQLPESLCGGINLWSVLQHDADYYYAGMQWGKLDDVHSVTIPVQPGDKLVATSFAKGIRVAYFDPSGLLVSIPSEQVKAEFAAAGFLTVPDGAVAANIPMWDNSAVNELYISNRPHTFEDDRCTLCQHQRLRVTAADMKQNVGAVYAADGTYNVAYTNNWFADLPIPKNAEQVCFLTFKTGSDCGSVFFGAGKPISGYADTEKGGQWVTLEIPTGADTFRYCYLNDTVAKNNGLPLFEYVEFRGTNLGPMEEPPFAYRPATGCHSFTVKVNIAPAQGNPNGYKPGTDYGYIQLPTNYDPYGEPTRLIIVCHGAGASLDTYRSDAWKTTNYSFWTDLGYAVMDMYACPPELTGNNDCLHYGNPVVLECYTKGYEYVLEHFNLKQDGIYLIGASMGGLSSFQIAQSGRFPVIAQVGYCPAIDLFKQAYCNPWTTASYQRSRIASYFDFAGTAPTFTNSKYPSAVEIEFYRQNLDKTVAYSPILCNVADGDVASIFDRIPKSATATDAAEAAIYAQLTATHPNPLLIFHNTDDSTVSYRYSQYFVDMVNRSGQEAKLYTFTSGGHNAWANGVNVTIQGINGPITIKESQYEAYRFFNQIEQHTQHCAWVDPAVEATCTETGLTQGKHCAFCGEELVKQNVVPVKDHEYKSQITTPTCTERGYTIYTCSCGDTYVSDEVPALGHIEETIPAVVATCIETGLTEGKKCSACGEILVDQVVVPTLGHDWKGTSCQRCDAKRENPFNDVADGSFYIDPVLWAVENGITSGATETTFNPGGTCLRAQVVSFLHRAAGNPAPASNQNPFTDVKDGDFFYQPVLWAVEKGITNGTTATTFGSYANCNRAAVVTFLWRAAGEPEPVSTDNPFTDVNETDFFYKPVLWAVENGITAGIDATHFGPTTDCNRAQVVTFLYRAYN